MLLLSLTCCMNGELKINLECFVKQTKAWKPDLPVFVVIVWCVFGEYLQHLRIYKTATKWIHWIPNRNFLYHWHNFMFVHYIVWLICVILGLRNSTTEYLSEFRPFSLQRMVLPSAICCVVHILLMFWSLINMTMPLHAQILPSMLKAFQWIIYLVANEWGFVCLCGIPAHIAFCGDTFDMSFSLPFIDYLPPTVPLKFFIRVSWTMLADVHFDLCD